MLVLVGQGYRIQYRDCTKPTKIIPYNRDTVCMNESKDENGLETFTLLKKENNQIWRGTHILFKRVPLSFIAGRSHTLKSHNHPILRSMLK